jgi:hypothetical protein
MAKTHHPTSDTVTSPYLLSHEAVTNLRLKNLSGLYWLVKEHRLPHCRRGGLYLFDTRELDAWLRNADTSVPTVTALRQLRTGCGR